MRLGSAFGAFLDPVADKVLSSFLGSYIFKRDLDNLVKKNVYAKFQKPMRT